MQTCKCDDHLNLKQFETVDEKTIYIEATPFMENVESGRPEVRMKNVL